MPVTTFLRFHHLQLAMPPGQEEAARAFYVDDPFGNRLEVLEPLR